MTPHITHNLSVTVYRHAKFECHSLNIVREISIILQVKHVFKFESQLFIRLRKDHIDLSSDYVLSKHGGLCLNIFWNNGTFIIFTIKLWPWMKVEVNIIHTWCILMSEAVTVPGWMMMTLIVSEESLARDTRSRTHARTDTHTHTHTHKMSLPTLQTKSFA